MDSADPRLPAFIPAVPDGYTEADVERGAPEPVKHTGRSPFARDRARVLHSSALRRLAAKTQVMIAGQSDFPRTRLTHTLEVAQIARELGASLGCDPDLVEVAALTHDLGHPPFGHNGETALNAIAAHIGGFEGNAQTLRILTRLDAKVLDAHGRSAGLNLTRASLDASCKYPWPRTPPDPKFGYYADDESTFDWLRIGSIPRRTCLEEQVMDWSDDVAYSVHDVEDAIHAGLVEPDDLRAPETHGILVGIAQERFVPRASDDALLAALDRLTSLPCWPTSFDGSMRDLVRLKELTTTLIGRFSVAAQLATQVVYGPDRLTRYAADLQIPVEARDEVAVMKAITVHYVLHRPGAEVEYARQREMIGELVTALSEADGQALEPWLAEDFSRATSDAERLRVIIDQVASLTDVSIVDWTRRFVPAAPTVILGSSTTPPGAPS